MSWAAERKTTRIEDEAYCLFGLFGINLPTLYGEGKNAFYRLQEEIMRTHIDTSLFAWGHRPTAQYAAHLNTISSTGSRRATRLNPHGVHSHLFAPSPAAFDGKNDVIFKATKTDLRAVSMTMIV